MPFDFDNADESACWTRRPARRARSDNDEESTDVDEDDRTPARPGFAQGFADWDLAPRSNRVIRRKEDL